MKGANLSPMAAMRSSGSLKKRKAGTDSRSMPHDAASSTAAAVSSPNRLVAAAGAEVAGTDGGAGTGETRAGWPTSDVSMELNNGHLGNTR